MKANIDKAINYLQLYRLGREPEFLMEAVEQIRKEWEEIKRAKQAETAKAQR
jgi:hypothetical protein